eukprot:CAMPEP_0178489236 /NCGR_PEP_ID=MMETSP0696-20121128/10272_1 /TAXON_ID=265572 /ORGANISM="Extubocellulus spinifer, Strain CCMP396" /LENGTH=405 /DNA_ID=CAMNT_0020117031 /DNA_START=54 /DNA_END=1271 /DNA_ORIENTATION=+
MTQQQQQHQQLMIRRSVPNDNACLFYALAYLCEDAEPSRKVECTLREVCAQSALNDSDAETRALFLGHPTVQVYADWIRNAHHWGGENEIVMLAEHYGVEVVVVSCESLSTLCYGQGSPNATHRVYILYTGQHYDPLVGATSASTPTSEEVRRFPIGGGDKASDIEASALSIARRHNAEAARRAKQRRVKRIKCGGCGVLLDDSTAFQEHCMEVEHGDDFAFDCEEVEVVVEDGEALPDGSIDLTDEDRHFIYYNADATCPLSSAWVGPKPIEVEGKSYRTLEHYWNSVRYETTDPDLARRIASADSPVLLSNTEGMDKARKDWDDVKEDMLLKGLRAKFAGPSKACCEAAAKFLVETSPKSVVCVSVDPWAGMSAAGGIATGQNHAGKALEVVRAEIIRAQDSS